MKYPIGIQSFDQIREDGYVYVDKTGFDLDWYTRQDSILSVMSFAKPAGKYLARYFQGRKTSFAGLDDWCTPCT